LTQKIENFSVHLINFIFKKLKRKLYHKIEEKTSLEYSSDTKKKFVKELDKTIYGNKNPQTHTPTDFSL
jgi:hypothetical protein